MDWNLLNEDFFLPHDMGLDFLADQSDGQYGDLKEVGQVSGELKHTQYEDVMELTSPPRLGSPHDTSWMETDISYLLDSLATPQEQSFSSDLSDITSSLPSDSGVKDNLSLLLVPNDIQNALMGMQTRTQDFMLTPPESPEQQVNPVIKVEETWSSTDDVNPAVLTDSMVLPEIQVNDTFDLTSVSFSEPSPVNQQVEEPVHFLGLTADDVADVLSSPEPNSPQSPSASSLIKSSPELYKVIAAPSNLSPRFSPYSKQKEEQKSKSSKSRTKLTKPLDLPSSPSSPVSDDVSNLSKKDRKKLQNKNAAIRYRQKKKQEAKSIYSEVEGLEDKNQELKVKVEDLEREIRYMKNLMEDIQKAKEKANG